MSDLPDVLIHQIAQALCFVEHGDWRYDPGKRSHRKWVKRAKRFAAAAELAYDRTQLSDGMGGSDGSYRAPTRMVQIRGRWLREQPK